MTAPTQHSIKQAFYALIKTDSAGTAVRAALGNGASSVLTRRQFETAAPSGLPAAPFMVLRFGPVTGQAFDMRSIFPTWWLYDDAAKGHQRLNDLAVLIEAVYSTNDNYPFSGIYSGSWANYAGGLSDEITDDRLARPALSMRYQVRNRF